MTMIVVKGDDRHNNDGDDDEHHHRHTTVVVIVNITTICHCQNQGHSDAQSIVIINIIRYIAS